MEVRFEVTIDERAFAQITQMTEQQTGRALEELVKRGEDYAYKKLSTPYPPSSAPGQFPHRRTGLLRAFTRHQPTASALHWQLISWMAYAPYLEFGTVRMAPRPFMRPTAQWMQDKAVEVFREAMR